MKMFSDSEDYEPFPEGTGFESYGEPGYSSMFSHWNEDDPPEAPDNTPHFRD